ncbi:MAG TPA: N-acetyltransferase [Caulobacteraceae bacterium]|jgi:predicted N-acetyltransferase YhbS|nr:N-acetyltransferase [Caulobacteraceae bacterium]
MTDLLLASDQPLAALPAHGGLTFALERPRDRAAADSLIDHAFGPGRFAKTAERLREGNRLRSDLSVCAWDGARMVGAVRQWPVLIGQTRAMFLGPFAVDSAWRHRRLGAALIGRTLALSDAAGERLTVLVGPASYFAPFGFEKVPAGRIVLPGPVDPHRLLWRATGAEAFGDVSGPVRIPRGG